MSERSFLDTVVGVASLVGLLAGGIWYAQGLQNQLDTANRQITELRTKLDGVTAQSVTTGARGPQGQKGDKGDTGDPGPQGPRGAPGVAPPRSDIEQTVIDILNSRKNAAVAPLPNASAPNQTVQTSPADDGCITNTQFANQSTFTVRAGMEVCDATGRLLAKVAKITVGGFPDYIGVNFEIPGHSPGFCWKNATSCAIPWLPDRQFYIERLWQDVDGGAAIFRVKS